MNGWMYLVIAGIAEVFYAASMLRTEGFTRIYPSIFCLTFIGVSMWIGPYISRHFLSLNPLLVRRRRYSRGERYPSALCGCHSL